MVALDDACPAAQAVHFVAPGAASASVIEPSPHSPQLAACAPEYNPATQSAQAVLAFDEAWPAAHAVHLVPPVDPSVSVTEPPLQAVHTDDSAPLYCPALHVLHAAAACMAARGRRQRGSADPPSRRPRRRRRPRLQVRIAGADAVDYHRVGAYFVTYDAEDAHGNKAQRQTRSIVVLDRTMPVQPNKTQHSTRLSLHGAHS